MQVAWIGAIALCASVRLLKKGTLALTKRSRSVLALMIALGVLFVISVLYSQGRTLSAEFSLLYFADLICIIEFVIDTYTNPPDWLQCIFQLRLVAIILNLLVLICIAIQPALVMNGDPYSSEVRLMGGSVCAEAVFLPIIMLVSAYSFLYGLESRAKSAILFLLGMGGLLVAQIRGADLIVLGLLFVIATWWARSSRNTSRLFAGGLVFAVLAFGALVATVGAGEIWTQFNRGQDVSNLFTASGRTIYWQDVIDYSVSHPWGMGYIAGIRHMQFGVHKANLHSDLTNPGGTDDAYMQTLTDAGWLSLGLYLLILGELFLTIWMLASRKSAVEYRDPRMRHAMRCLFLLFACCLLEAIEGSGFAVPLQQEFYLQNVLVAMILGASTTVTLAARARRYKSAGISSREPGRAPFPQSGV